MKKTMLVLSYIIVSLFVIFLFKYGIENEKDAFIYIALVGGIVLFVFIYLMFNIKVKNFELDIDDKSIKVNHNTQEERKNNETT